MPRSNQRHTVAVALSVLLLLLAAVPSLAAPSTPVGKGSGGSAPEVLLQNLWQWLEGLWTASSVGGDDDGDAGARIDGNGFP